MINDPIQEIKSRIDIVDLISGYIKLDKAGVNFRARCPFHNEKTPSFIVSQEKQIWHCFGSCDEGGDIFKFVMKMDGLEFPEALRFLADKASVQLKKQDPKLQSEKTKLLDFHERACAYFETCLKACKPAQNYFKKRGLLKKTIQEFQLGYAPENTKALKQFKSRIIFPICDLNSQVIAFTARVLDKKLPKYINSPDSLIYKKSLVLYGLDKAKQEIRKKNLAILVEGNMDVIMSHQAGITNTVASSGTALSQEQIQIIKRYTNNIALAFDSDSAGSQATKRTIDLALQQDMQIKIILLKSKDPADLIIKNPKEWKKAIKKAKNIMQYYFQEAFKKNNPKTAQGKKNIANILLPIISQIPNKIEQIHWIQKLGNKINIDENILFEQISSVKLEKLPTPNSQLPTKSRLKKLQDRLDMLKKDELLIDNPKKEIKACQKEIKILELKDSLEKLSKQIKKAEQNNKQKIIKNLLKQFQDATQKINNYQR